MRQVALLRGINVGGNNLIKMSALKSAFEDAGFENVATYIASGNVLFDATGSAASLEERIEKTLRATFGYDARVLVRSRTQLATILKSGPKGWPDPKLRCNIIFLKAPLTPKVALAAVPPLKEGVDTVDLGPGVLYLGQVLARMSQSRVSKIASMPEYKSMTIRTYGTCAKILERMNNS